MPPQPDDPDDKVKSLETRYADFEPAPAPAGGPSLGYAMEPAEVAPPMVESICARGPCRHFWSMTSSAPAGNPSGTFEALGLREPRQHNYVCLAHPGTETDLGDDQVFDCNRWDPIPASSLARLARRRRAYERAPLRVRFVELLRRLFRLAPKEI
jgi:hypothetical protein